MQCAVELVQDCPLPDIPVLRPEQSQKLLGRFYKAPLPFSNGHVDMRLADDKVMPAAQEILTDLERKCVIHRILIGKSGDGKTRALFDIARTHFTVYMECVSDGTLLEDIRDRAYANFDSRIRAYIDKDGAKNGANIIMHMLRVEVASHLLFLHCMLQKHPTLTLHQFLLTQLNGGNATIGRFAVRLKKLDDDFLLDLLIVLCSRKQIIFAVDEAGAAAQSFFGYFKCPSTKSNRGLLTALKKIITALPISTVYASTYRSLGFGESIVSDIGKKGSVKIVANFHTTTERKTNSFSTQTSTCPIVISLKFQISDTSPEDLASVTWFSQRLQRWNRAIAWIRNKVCLNWQLAM